MTARDMQIEFERLVQLANPQFDYQSKLDSDTIFYFINAAQERYIKQSFINTDSVKKDSNSYKRLIDMCKALIVNKTLTDNISGLEYQYVKTFKLPSNDNDKFYIYLSSYSSIIDLRDNKSKIANNFLLSAEDIEKVLVTNSNKPILRNPGVVLSGTPGYSSINVYFDLYTTLNSCNITYIRKPLDINVISSNDTTQECELDSNIHRELVESAVDMFITEGAYRLSASPSKHNENNDNNKDSNQ